MKVDVVWYSDTLTPGIAEFIVLADQVVEQILEALAERVQDYARSNAPWDDRTGDARSGLTAEVVNEGLGVSNIVLYHTVDYGIWLEVRWSGRYAIIVPTMEHYGPIIMAELSGLFGAL